MRIECSRRPQQAQTAACTILASWGRAYVVRRACHTLRLAPAPVPRASLAEVAVRLPPTLAGAETKPGYGVFTDKSTDLPVLCPVNTSSVGSVGFQPFRPLCAPCPFGTWQPVPGSWNCCEYFLAVSVVVLLFQGLL